MPSTPTPPKPPSATTPAIPQGMTDVDYEAIEAAVTETVRGRWFLNEFARRNRAAEAKLVLDGLSRLESLITANQAAALLPPPSADPSIRLMIQRIKEIAGQLDALVHEMRDDGVEERYCDAVDQQARSVAGLMRTGSGPTPEARASASRLERTASLPEPLAPPLPADPRLEALAGLDGLSLAKKLALFT